MDYYLMLLDSFLSGQAFRTSACLHSDCKYKWLKPDNDKNVRLFSSFMVRQRRMSDYFRFPLLLNVSTTIIHFARTTNDWKEIRE